ncbi:hypothetical protein ES705_26271 [subsurface metagenome]
MEKDIGKLVKNDMTDIVVRIDDFGGRPGVTIREFVTGDRYTGFTKSGVKISAENFPKFKEMINSIQEDDLKLETSEEEFPKEQETLQETVEKEGSEEEIKVEKPGEAAETPKETSEQTSKDELPDY